jgi:hypothetical protein
MNASVVLTLNSVALKCQVLVSGFSFASHIFYRELKVIVCFMVLLFKVQLNLNETSQPM